MKHFIDHDMSKATMLLDKATGEEAGKILAYYSNNPAGSVCHACVILYPLGYKILGRERTTEYAEEGKAGGYGYDKYSAAVSDSLHKQGLGCTHAEMNSATFGDGTFSAESQRKKADALEIIKKTGKIPVYSGAGNVNEAFSLYFRVVAVL